MKTNLYRFSYEFEGESYRDLVAAESIKRAEFIHSSRYPNVKDARIELVGAVLV